MDSNDHLTSPAAAHDRAIGNAFYDKLAASMPNQICKSVVDLQLKH